MMRRRFFELLDEIPTYPFTGEWNTVDNDGYILPTANKPLTFSIEAELEGIYQITFDSLQNDSTAGVYINILNKTLKNSGKGYYIARQRACEDAIVYVHLLGGTNELTLTTNDGDSWWVKDYECKKVTALTTPYIFAELDPNDNGTDGVCFTRNENLSTSVVSRGFQPERCYMLRASNGLSDEIVVSTTHSALPIGNYRLYFMANCAKGIYRCKHMYHDNTEDTEITKNCFTFEVEAAEGVNTSQGERIVDTRTVITVSPKLDKFDEYIKLSCYNTGWLNFAAAVFVKSSLPFSVEKASSIDDITVGFEGGSWDTNEIDLDEDDKLEVNVSSASLLNGQWYDLYLYGSYKEGVTATYNAEYTKVAREAEDGTMNYTYTSSKKQTVYKDFAVYVTKHVEESVS